MALSGSWTSSQCKPPSVPQFPYNSGNAELLSRVPEVYSCVKQWRRSDPLPEPVNTSWHFWDKSSSNSHPPAAPGLLGAVRDTQLCHSIPCPLLCKGTEGAELRCAHLLQRP